MLAINSRAGDLAAHITGTGPTIVLLHSLLSDRGSLEPVISLLRDDFRLVVIDMPGFGESAACHGGLDVLSDRLAKAVTHFCDDGKPILFGNGYGSFAALSLALRHPAAVSTLFDLGSGRFGEIVPDREGFEGAKRVFLCSGKVFYDLDERRTATQNRDTALMRIEQLYPFPETELAKVLSSFGSGVEIFWVQEEPANMGGYRFVAPLIEGITGKRIDYIGRPASATPATGYGSAHKKV